MALKIKTGKKKKPLSGSDNIKQSVTIGRLLSSTGSSGSGHLGQEDLMLVLLKTFSVSSNNTGKGKNSEQDLNGKMKILHIG